MNEFSGNTPSTGEMASAEASGGRRSSGGDELPAKTIKETVNDSIFAPLINEFSEYSFQLPVPAGGPVQSGVAQADGDDKGKEEQVLFKLYVLFRKNHYVGPVL